MIVARGRVRLRVWLIVGAVAVVAVLGGAWVWLRDSSLVSVERVTVTGVSGPDAGQIRHGARTSSARNMTTLDVRVGQLRTAVAPYPVVKDLRVSTQFPHGMRIHVIEQLPVGAILAAGRTIAASRRRHAAPRRADGVAADGSAHVASGRIARHRPDRPGRADAARRDAPAVRGEDQPGHDDPAARAGRTASLRPGHLLRRTDGPRREVGGGDGGARRSELGGRCVHRRDRSGAAGRRASPPRRSPLPGSRRPPRRHP